MNIGTSVIVVFLFCLTAGAASATPDEDYARGLAAYKSGNYKAAAQSFHQAVTGGKNTAAAWLYLGHAYSATNDRNRAAQVYRSLSSKFPGTPESQLALRSLQKIAPPAAVAASVTPAVPGAAPVANPIKFKDRITLYPPKFGHQPVSSSTAATVRAVVDQLPPKIMKILDDGGATITIAPNIIDKWPGSGDGMKPGSSTVTMGEEGGRTYGHDVHVYERKQVRGSTDLLDIRSQSEIRHTTMHEIGHAVDDCSGPLSSDPTFKSMLKLDIDNMPEDVQSHIRYYLDPGEACAENVKGLIGGSDDSDTVMVMQNMPRLHRYIKQKLKL
jgi:hypothetical protein